MSQRPARSHRRDQRRIARQALHRVGLSGEIGRAYPHELSGGMRQRVVLARVACLRPPLLLMDEPFASLDEVTRHRLQEDLLELWRTDRQTLLFVTHSLEEAVFLADRVVVLGFTGMAADRTIDWPRPRDRYSPSFVALMAEFRSALDRQGSHWPVQGG